MLHELFYWILNMSILGTLYGLLIYTLRLIKGFPRFGSYTLWGVVFLRLVCPIGISSRYSLLSLLSDTFSRTLIRTVTIYEETGQESLQLTLTNMVRAASDYQPITYKSNLLENFFRVASMIWIIVTVAGILACIALYLISVSELKKAVHLQDEVYAGTMVDTPIIYGLIKPKIVLPLRGCQECPEQVLQSEGIEQVLLHERIHMRRRDNLWRMTAILTACIHWFNPFVWFFLRSFINDSELACDVRAVKTMKSEERKAYARALLAYGSGERTLFSSAFGSGIVKVRIRSVLTYRRLTIVSSICFGLMAVLMAFLLLTNQSG